MSQLMAGGQVVAERYELVSEIGRGGSGSVWRARDLATERAIALKLIIPARGAQSPTATQVGRLLREANAMAELRSPYVAEVIDHGSWESSSGAVVYLAMELLEGESLRERLDREPQLPSDLVLQIMSQVGRAVAFAHRRGIVHRDLKPANVFLCRGDEGLVCKVLDFGLAKSWGMPLNERDGVHTRVGKPLGTPFYMSPEQARGAGNVDHRSDLWSLGVMAYECLCGKRPFGGDSIGELLTNIVMGTPTPPSQLASVPSSFDAWFARAIDRDVQSRFQSVSTMLDELREALTDTDTLARTSTGLVMLTLGDLTRHTLMAGTEMSGRTVRRTPAVSTSFVARDELLAELRGVIKSPCRVITLAGDQGTGRARLAHELGIHSAPEFPGGLWTCSLDAVTDIDTMYTRMARAIGCQLNDADPVAALGQALDGMGRMLLLLRNVDGVKKGLAPRLANWLSRAPKALFVVTSRSALDVPTERVIRVGPLPCAPVTSDARELNQHGGSSLLARRVIAHDRSLLDDAEAVQAIANLAMRAGGNPFALELIAAQCGAETLPQLLASLDAALMQPGGTAVIQPDMVLTSILAWVVGRLSEAERDVMIQLTVFEERFTAQSAEQVVELEAHAAMAGARLSESTAETLERRPPPVADLCRRFEKLGLLSSAVTLAGEPGYVMAPLVRRHLGELASPETMTRVRDRLGSHLAHLGADESLLALHRRGGWMRRGRYLEAFDDAVAAHKHALDKGKIGLAAMLGRAAAAAEVILGRPASAARLLLPGCGDEVPAPLRLRCTLDHGRALTLDGRPPRAAEVLNQAERLASDEPARRADALRARGELALLEGHRMMARRYLLEARDVAWSCGDRLGAAEALLSVSLLDPPTEAVQMLEQALESFLQMAAQHMAALAHEHLGLAHERADAPRKSAAALDAALEIHHRQGDRRAAARVLARRGSVGLATGEVKYAVDTLSQAAQRARELGDLRLEGETRGMLAEAHAADSNVVLASRCIDEAEHLLRIEEDRSAHLLASLYCRRARMQLVQGDYATAARSLQAAVDAAGTAALAPVQLTAELDQLRKALERAAPASRR